MINGTAEWHALDTNDDGWVDMYDDPYTPFYPGDQWVDWVGMNMYHMGQVSPLLLLQDSIQLVQCTSSAAWHDSIMFMLPQVCNCRHNDKLQTTLTCVSSQAL